MQRGPAAPKGQVGQEPRCLRLVTLVGCQGCPHAERNHACVITLTWRHPPHLSWLRACSSRWRRRDRQETPCLCPGEAPGCPSCSSKSLTKRIVCWGTRAPPALKALLRAFADFKIVLLFSWQHHFCRRGEEPFSMQFLCCFPWQCTQFKVSDPANRRIAAGSLTGCK